MKISKDQQTAINEIARNSFIADTFGKVKCALVKAHKDLIEAREAEFRKGIPAEFEYDGRTITCKLTMTPSPKWSTRDVVVSAR